MVRDAQKSEEKALASMAAAILGEEWNLVDSERPDFIVNTLEGDFGLEVTSCFSGDYKKGSSLAVQSARYRQEKLHEIREKCLARFPQIAPWSLSYMDEWNDGDVETRIVAAIESVIRDEKQDIFSVSTFQEETGEPVPLNIPKILINKHPRPFLGDAWKNMKDHAGPPEISSLSFQLCIDKKAKKIPQYRNKHEDVRLLVSAFSLESSGNVSIDEDFIPNIYDFNRVYFMHAPNYVVEFPSGLVKSLTGRTPECFSRRTQL